MRIQIAARHCEIPDSVRTRTEQQVNRLAKYDRRISAAEVVFEEEKHIRKIEAILYVDRSQPVFARAEASEFQTAVDKVVDRLGRIVKRQRSQAKSHHGKHMPEGVPGN